MLRQTHRPWKPSVTTRTLAVALILCSGVFAAGVRRPLQEPGNDDQQSQSNLEPTPKSRGFDDGQQSDAETTATQSADVSGSPVVVLNNAQIARANGPIAASYVPGDTAMFAAIRPLKLRLAMAQDDRLTRMSHLVPDAIWAFAERLPFENSLAEFDQISCLLDLDGIVELLQTGSAEGVIVKQWLTPDHAPSDFSAGAESRATIGQVPYFRSRVANWFVVDNRSVIAHVPGHGLKHVIVNGPLVRSEILNSHAWQEAAKEAHVAVAVNLEMLGRLLPVELSPYLAVLTPLWETGDNAVLSARIENERVFVRLVVNCRNEVGTEGVRKTLVALQTLYGNMLNGLAKQANRVGPDPMEAAMIAAILNAPRDLVASAEIESAGNQVVVTASHDIDAELVQLLVKVIENAQKVAKRQSDLDDLKQLGLALHNYHDTHLQFPPAVVIDKESGVSRSWRIEILPFVGKTRLYYQYRKDEPWDSEHNKQILAKMPEVFRSTGMASDSTETRYLAPVGPGTVFDPSKPIRIRDISDGTSNTLMVVQSPQKSVPWTKPVNLPVNLAVSQGGGDEFDFGGYSSDVSGSFSFDEATQQLDLGGLEKAGFLAVFCDGAVAVLKSGIAPAVLRQLLCRADGYPINAADFLDKSEMNRISRLRGDAATKAETSK